MNNTNFIIKPNEIQVVRFLHIKRELSICKVDKFCEFLYSLGYNSKISEYHYHYIKS